MKENSKIRNAARIANIPQWKIADALGISEATFTRWLRFTLSPERENEVMAIINKLALEKQEAI